MNPYVSSEYNGGIVDKLHRVKLACDTPGASIFYTTDGTVPELHKARIKVQSSELVLLSTIVLTVLRDIMW